MRIPVYINGDIPMSDLSRALQSVGYHMRIDAGHRFVVDRVPAVIAKDENVVQLRAKRK